MIVPRFVNCFYNKLIELAPSHIPELLSCRISIEERQEVYKVWVHHHLSRLEPYYFQMPKRYIKVTLHNMDGSFMIADKQYLEFSEIPQGADYLEYERIITVIIKEFLDIMYSTNGFRTVSPDLLFETIVIGVAKKE